MHYFATEFTRGPILSIFFHTHLNTPMFKRQEWPYFPISKTNVHSLHRAANLYAGGPAAPRGAGARFVGTLRFVTYEIAIAGRLALHESQSYVVMM